MIEYSKLKINKSQYLALTTQNTKNMFCNVQNKGGSRCIDIAC